MAHSQNIAKQLALSLKNEAENSIHICKRLRQIARENLNYDDLHAFERKFIDFQDSPFPEMNPIYIKGS